MHGWTDADLRLTESDLEERRCPDCDEWDCVCELEPRCRCCEEPTDGSAYCGTCTAGDCQLCA